MTLTCTQPWPLHPTLALRMGDESKICSSTSVIRNSVSIFDLIFLVKWIQYLPYGPIFSNIGRPPLVIKEGFPLFPRHHSYMMKYRKFKVAFLLHQNMCVAVTCVALYYTCRGVYTLALPEKYSMPIDKFQFVL